MPVSYKVNLQIFSIYLNSLNACSLLTFFFSKSSKINFLFLLPFQKFLTCHHINIKFNWNQQCENGLKLVKITPSSSHRCRRFALCLWMWRRYVGKLLVAEQVETTKKLNAVNLFLMHSMQPWNFSIIVHNKSGAF